jgi:hypothetical protein
MARLPHLLGGLVLTAILACAVGAAGAEESRPALNAPLIMQLLALPVERPEALLQESLRQPVRERAAGGWELLPDGSARYGNDTLHVIIRNPCPAGSLYKSPPLPGRAVR